jgi:hypothetical protein
MHQDELLTLVNKEFRSVKPRKNDEYHQKVFAELMARKEAALRYPEIYFKYLIFQTALIPPTSRCNDPIETVEVYHPSGLAATVKPVAESWRKTHTVTYPLPFNPDFDPANVFLHTHDFSSAFVVRRWRLLFGAVVLPSKTGQPT